MLCWVISLGIFFRPSEAITIKVKSYQENGQNYQTRSFFDDRGREVFFRGWNVSGASKLKEMHFLPFKNAKEAAQSFTLMKNNSGANLIRFTLSWEGLHLSAQKIASAYLEQALAQIKEAIKRDIYILLDWHQDLFSQYALPTRGATQGNGAPRWVVEAMDLPTSWCLPFCVHWSQHALSNLAVRKAYRDFWNNRLLVLNERPYFLQDLYLWQMQKALEYFKGHLSPEEFRYILGVDPFNEPSDGGMEDRSPKEWDNEVLWPFYEKVRAILDLSGYEEKFVFAEPLVYWNSTMGVFAPPTGGKHLTYKPGPRFVFNSHFYDARRMSTSYKQVQSGEYLKDYQEIRDEASFLTLAPFVSEFGAPNKGLGARDPQKILLAHYQALELGGSKERELPFHHAYLSHTQWQWDYSSGTYRSEFGLPRGDGWNKEDFSVIAHHGEQWTLPLALINRPFPRALQGELVHFSTWPALGEQSGKDLIFASLLGKIPLKAYLLVTWKNTFAQAPSEIYLPKEMQDFCFGDNDSMGRLAKSKKYAVRDNILNISLPMREMRTLFLYPCSQASEIVPLLPRLRQEVLEREHFPLELWNSP